MTDSTPNRPLRVFLCHASGDKPAVRELYHRLTADGFAPWLDEIDILPGRKWQREIPKAVRNSDVVVVCLSRSSINKEGYVQKEIKFALEFAEEKPDDTIFLIPLRLEDCDVPEQLSHWQWVNHFDTNGYSRLVQSLCSRAEGLGLSQSPTASAGSSAPPSPVKDAPTLTKPEKHRSMLQQAIMDAQIHMDQLEQSRVQTVIATDALSQLLRQKKSLTAEMTEIEQRLSDQPSTILDQPIAQTPTPASVTGGVKVDANTVSVGRDVAGRDLINQTTYNIAQATFIQGGAAAPEIKPIEPAETTNHPTQATRVDGLFAATSEDALLAKKARFTRLDRLVATPSENRRVIDGMEFVRVPAGEFLMGSTSDNELASDNEHPQHTVEIPYDYWIDKYPVTNAQFAKFVSTAEYKFTLDKDWQKKANHPVTRVKWRDALAYCQWLNDLTRGELNGLTVRLPTEAEWEMAARGTDGRIYPWGNEWDQNKCNTHEGGKRTTTPVGAYSPQGDTPYGAADMVGNVWEWCHSLYKPYPYQANDGRENETDSGRRVLRGGSWGYELRDARCAARHRLDPDRFLNDFGFRVVLSLAYSEF